MNDHKGPMHGYEDEAFDRKGRRRYAWGRGEIKKLKRAFARRMRRIAGVAARQKGSGDRSRQG